MTEKYPFELAPGAQLIVTDQLLDDVLNDIAGLMAPERGLSATMIDVLMVVYVHTKQAKQAMRDARLLYKDKAGNVDHE